MKWRLRKHMDLHNNPKAKKCHFFNNKKHCPFQEVGCKFLHETSEKCYFQDNCRNALCPYQHETKKQVTKDSVEAHSEIADVTKKNVDQKYIISGFENNSKTILKVRTDCGFDNNTDKCNICKYKTFSVGLIRKHQKENHKKWHSYDSVIEGFKIDDTKYKELLRAMYDEEEILTFECKACDVKTHSEGTLRIHENEAHFMK